MSAVRVKISAQASAEIEDAALYFVEISVAVFDRFFKQLADAKLHIANFPASGLIRYAHELNIPNLRYWALRDFPYALFYIHDSAQCTVIRCAHLASDIPASLREVLPTQH